LLEKVLDHFGVCLAIIMALDQQKISDSLEKCLNTGKSAPIGSKKLSPVSASG